MATGVILGWAALAVSAAGAGVSAVQAHEASNRQQNQAEDQKVAEADRLKAEENRAAAAKEAANSKEKTDVALESEQAREDRLLRAQKGKNRLRVGGSPSEGQGLKPVGTGLSIGGK